MRVKILKPWICGGKNPPVGKVIDLPQVLAKSGIERGLCKSANRQGTTRRVPSNPAGKQQGACKN